MKTTHERFDEQFTDNGNSWSNVHIYRDGGHNTIVKIKSFIDQEIERAVAEERKRIVEIIRTVFNDIEQQNQDLDIRSQKDYIINLITNK